MLPGRHALHSIKQGTQQLYTGHTPKVEVTPSSLTLHLGPCLCVQHAHGLQCTSDDTLAVEHAPGCSTSETRMLLARQATSSKGICSSVPGQQVASLRGAPRRRVLVHADDPFQRGGARPSTTDEALRQLEVNQCWSGWLRLSRWSTHSPGCRPSDNRGTGLALASEP
jgi:hypothetical protein